MAANKKVFFPQIALTTTITNLYSPGTTTGGTNMPANVANLYFLFQHLRVVNTTNAAINVAFWKQVTIGSTPVAGKEVIAGGAATLLALNAGTGVAIPGGGVFDYFTPVLRLDAADTDKFLVGGASAAGLTVYAEGEIGVS